MGICVAACQHHQLPPISVGMKAAFPRLCNELRKSGILFRPVQTMDKGIVPASGYSEVDDDTVLTAQQIKALQRRNAQLEEENLILKKAIAIFTPHSDND